MEHTDPSPRATWSLKEGKGQPQALLRRGTSRCWQGEGEKQAWSFGVQWAKEMAGEGGKLCGGSEAQGSSKTRLKVAGRFGAEKTGLVNMVQ